MWSLDRRAVSLIVLMAAGLSLAGCQVRPLYGTQLGYASITPDLRAIDINVDGQERVAQTLRNELIFALRGGAAQDTSSHELSVLLSKRTQRVAVEGFEDVPNAFLVELVATYTLFDLTARRTLLTGTSFANSSYDFSSQRFANIRALRDAEDRAAKVVATDMRTRVATYFANRKPSAVLTR